MKYFLIVSLLVLVSCSQQNDQSYSIEDAQDKFINTYPDLKIDSIEKEFKYLLDD